MIETLQAQISKATSIEELNEIKDSADQLLLGSLSGLEDQLKDLATLLVPNPVEFITNFIKVIKKTITQIESQKSELNSTLTQLENIFKEKEADLKTTP